MLDWYLVSLNISRRFFNIQRTYDFKFQKFSVKFSHDFFKAFLDMWEMVSPTSNLRSTVSSFPSFLLLNQLIYPFQRSSFPLLQILPSSQTLLCTTHPHLSLWKKAGLSCIRASNGKSSCRNSRTFLSKAGMDYPVGGKDPQSR